MIDLLWRLENNGETIPAPSATDSVFSSTEEGLLFDLNCWVEFRPFVPHPVEKIPLPVNDRRGGQRDPGDAADTGAKFVTVENEVDASVNTSGWVTQEGPLGGLVSQVGEEEEEEEGAIAAWLRSIGSKLAEKCAEVCDAAWHEMGETITYRGRPVTQGLVSAEAMDRAAQRREEKQKIGTENV